MAGCEAHYWRGPLSPAVSTHLSISVQVENRIAFVCSGSRLIVHRDMKASPFAQRRGAREGRAAAASVSGDDFSGFFRWGPSITSVGRTLLLCLFSSEWLVAKSSVVRRKFTLREGPGTLRDHSSSGTSGCCSSCRVSTGTRRKGGAEANPMRYVS